MMILMRLVQQARALLALGVCIFMLCIPTLANAERILSLFISGQAQPYISNPQGFTLGIEPGTGQLKQNIADAELNLGASHSYVAIQSPTTGVYSVTLHGSYEETLSIKVEYRDTVAGTNSNITQQALFHGDTIQFTVELDHSAEALLLITPPVDMPFNLALEDNAGLGRLTWDASSDLAVVGYRVYARLTQSALFQSLGDVTTTFFDTSHLIRLDDTGDHWKYIVVSLAADGRESFYSTVLNNRIFMAAFFDADVRRGSPPLTVSFSDDSIGGPTLWSWDFDNDGVEDSTQQDPTFTFDTPGTYSVKLSITGPSGSDENTRIDYISVTLDNDGDGIDDTVDNCSAVANDSQQDTDGDGIGDACQCGDMNGDGKVTNTDAVLIQRHLVGLTSPFNPDLCDVNGDGNCSNTDAVIIKRAVLGLPPGVAHACAATMPAQ